VTRTCQKCGDSFNAGGAWQRLCWRCWRDDQDQEIFDQGYRAGRRDGYTVGYIAGRRDSGPLEPVPARLGVATLRELVVLCHPDRHPPERFEQANRATRELLAMLENGAGAA
jgi:hypothetical protein